MIDNDRLKEERARLVVKQCSQCHKPTVRGTLGTLTSWIFSNSKCGCREPKITIDDQSDTLAADNIAYPDLDEDLEVISLIGKGGMGLVYKVRDKKQNVVFAAKLLREEFTGDRVSVKRFEQEAALATALTHANLVPVYCHRMSRAGAPYLLMDYIEGVTLDVVLRDKVYLKPSRALNIFIQCCEAMVHAHMKCVTHRDLKPSNVILTAVSGGGEIARITDFGISKPIDHQNDTRTLTRTNDIVGTAQYMSPEQCTGTSVDARSDIYSLGCIMYETLTGKPPFVGANPIKTIMKHLQDAPMPLRYGFRGLEISPSLELVVLRCLQKDPAKRYQTAQALLCDLQLTQSGRPIREPGAVNWRYTNYGSRKPLQALVQFLLVLFLLESIFPLFFYFAFGSNFYLVVTIPFVWLPLILLVLCVFLLRCYKLFLVAFRNRKCMRSGDYWLLLFYQSISLDLAALSCVLLGIFLFLFPGSPLHLSLSPLCSLPAWAACLATLMVLSPLFFGSVWLVRRKRKAEFVSGW